MRQQRNISILAFLLLGTVLLSSCTSVITHGGIHYKIAPDKLPNQTHRVEKGRDGRLMYDSPELTVICDQKRMKVNGEDCGAVEPGDNVEITDLGTVLVNGERRGDTMTGSQKKTERIEHMVR